MADTRLDDYEQRIIADMMLGSGVFTPRRDSRGHKAGKKLVRAGYIRTDDAPDPYIDRPQYVITARGRDYFNQQKRVRGSAIAKRVAFAQKRQAHRAQPTKRSEAARLSEAIRRAK